MDNLLNNALRYLEKGFSIIPCKLDKRPLTKWEEFQTRKPTREEVTDWWTYNPKSMIGIVTGSVSGVSVVDIDEPQGHEAIQEYIPDSLLIPTARTPRGGQHLYFETPTPPLSNNARIIPGCDFRGQGGYLIAPPSRSAKGAYLWEPGLSIFEIPPPALPVAYINKVLNSMKYMRGQNALDHTRPQLTTTDHTLFIDGNRDESLFHVANLLFKGGGTENEARQVLEKLALSCNPPFPSNEIEAKIQSALKREERRETSIAEDVRDFVVTTTGHFMTTECHNRLQVTTRHEKKAVTMALLRMLKEGLIERYGNRDGCYRKVENQAEDIDILSDQDAPLDVKWPLALESMVHTMPKSIIIIAGEGDSGKTGFLLNFSELNMDQHKIFYFSSEMGATELKDRVSKFDRPLKDWKKITFKERSLNFADVILPDAINIIDYLELTDEFYRVGGQIKGIFDKLNKGIAIIALQKKTGAVLGRGGDFSMEKARLYISLSRDNICRIVKAKNWVNPMLKPAGRIRKYALYQGCKFIPRSNWMMEGQRDE